MTVLWAEDAEADGQTVIFEVPESVTTEWIDLMGNPQTLPTRNGLVSVPVESEVKYVLLRGGEDRVAGALASLDPSPAGEPDKPVVATAQLRNPTQRSLAYQLNWSATDNPVLKETIELAAGENRIVEYALKMPVATVTGETIPHLTLQYAMNDGDIGGTLTAPLRVAQLIPIGRIIRSD